MELALRIWFWSARVSYGRRCSSGFAVSRFGNKPMMLFGLAMTAFIGFVCNHFYNAWQLSVAAFLLGGGIAVRIVFRVAHISILIPLRQRGRAIATMAGLQRFGNFIGPLVTSCLDITLDLIMCL